MILTLSLLNLSFPRRRFVHLYPSTVPPWTSLGVFPNVSRFIYSKIFPPGEAPGSPIPPIIFTLIIFTISLPNHFNCYLLRSKYFSAHIFIGKGIMGIMGIMVSSLNFYLLFLAPARRGLANRFSGFPEIFLMRNYSSMFPMFPLFPVPLPGSRSLALLFPSGCLSFRMCTLYFIFTGYTYLNTWGSLYVL